MYYNGISILQLCILAGNKTHLVYNFNSQGIQLKRSISQEILNKFQFVGILYRYFNIVNC